MWRWVLSWNRELLPEELVQLNQLQELLQHHHPTKDERDRVYWSAKGSFTVTGLMAEADKASYGEAEVDSLVCNVWKNIAPPKVEFMLWLTLLGKLNTRDLLVKKGILSPQANLCTFCSEQPESIDHLLLHCQVSWQVWCSVAQGLGLQIVRQFDFQAIL